MELTDRQSEIRMAINEVAKTPVNDSWGDFIDFTRAVATMIEGVETLVSPQVMEKRFSAAWQAFAKICVAENNRILRDCLGSDEEFDRVKNHPNGGNALGRILRRVKDVHGELTPGMSIDVDIDDILADELGDT